MMRQSGGLYLQAVDDVRDKSRRLLEYCRAHDWAGYDPYDALNSPLTRLPPLDRRLPRLVLTQLLKRSPINIRPLLLIPKTQNPKALALFLAAVLRMPHLGEEQPVLADALTRRLIELRSPSSRYWCWGYSFPWQTRTLIVPRAAPNLVCTVFVASALLDAFEHFGDARYLTMAVNAAEYIHDDLFWTGTGISAGFGYPTPAVRVHIHNANLLGAALLCRVSAASGDTRFLDAANRAARYSATCQAADGSWPYGEADTQGWIDNFHTGYNLCALRVIARAFSGDGFDVRIRNGFEFYRAHFFRPDGAARYYHDRTYPIDIHSVAQSLITLMTLRDLDADNVALAERVYRWAVRHMLAPEGFFYYRVLRFATIKTPYMRWSQAWMLLAMAELARGLEAASQTTPLSPQGL